MWWCCVIKRWLFTTLLLFCVCVYVCFCVRRGVAQPDIDGSNNIFVNAKKEENVYRLCWLLHHIITQFTIIIELKTRIERIFWRFFHLLYEHLLLQSVSLFIIIFLELAPLFFYLNFNWGDNQKRKSDTKNVWFEHSLINVFLECKWRFWSTSLFSHWLSS